HDVQQHETRLELLEPGKRGLAVFRGLDVVSSRLEERLHDLAGIGIVVDDQDSLAHGSTLSGGLGSPGRASPGPRPQETARLQGPRWPFCRPDPGCRTRWRWPTLRSRGSAGRSTR